MAHNVKPAQPVETNQAGERTASKSSPLVAPLVIEPAQPVKHGKNGTEVCPSALNILSGATSTLTQEGSSVVNGAALDHSSKSTTFASKEDERRTSFAVRARKGDYDDGM